MAPPPPDDEERETEDADDAATCATDARTVRASNVSTSEKRRDDEVSGQRYKRSERGNRIESLSALELRSRMCDRFHTSFLEGQESSCPRSASHGPRFVSRFLPYFHLPCPPRNRE